MLTLLGKAWKNTQEVGNVFFNGKKYSKDSLKKVADEVIDEPAIEKAIETQFNEIHKGQSYDKIIKVLKTPELRAKFTGEQKQGLASIENEIQKMRQEIIAKRFNALSPEKQELYNAYGMTHTKNSGYESQWKHTGNPNISIGGFEGLKLRHTGKPNQATEDLLSVSAVAATGVVGYSALSHFTGGDD